jgi:phosphomethylpyrimidine synthase
MQRSSIEQELGKLQIIEKAGADTVMDLSTGEDLDKTRLIILANSSIPLVTVPIYQEEKRLLTKKAQF